MRLIALFLALLISAPALGKQVIVGGTIRQDPQDRTKWSFVADEQHSPAGFTPTVTVSGTDLILTFDKKFKRIVSFVAGPDETMASQMGVSVGASVNVDSVALRLSVNKAISGKVWWEDGKWHHQPHSFVGEAEGGPVEWIGATLIVNTEELWGEDLTVTAWTRDGTVIPYIPAARVAYKESFSVNFLDGGQFAAIPNERMAFAYSKTISAPVRMDDKHGSFGLPLFSGNIWFVGVMER